MALPRVSISSGAVLCCKLASVRLHSACSCGQSLKFIVIVDQSLPSDVKIHDCFCCESLSGSQSKVRRRLARAAFRVPLKSGISSVSVPSTALKVSFTTVVGRTEGHGSIKDTDVNAICTDQCLPVLCHVCLLNVNTIYYERKGVSAAANVYNGCVWRMSSCTGDTSVFSCLKRPN